jgi:hypothetical protein
MNAENITSPTSTANSFSQSLGELALDELLTMDVSTMTTEQKVAYVQELQRCRIPTVAKAKLAKAPKQPSAEKQESANQLKLNAALQALDDL